MARALLIVLDSFGCGGATDAAAYGDEGADTLGHIAEACARGAGDRRGLRSGPLRLPHLSALGLGEAARLSTGRRPCSFPAVEPLGAWGCASEVSPGKDTPSGHWELAGSPAVEPFGYFPDTDPAFPQDLIQALIEQARLPGVLGDRHDSGVAIVEALGAESVRSGKPICYTSIDSVFQIAAHEQSFGLDRLYETCRVARALCDPLRIGRVIARPFVGTAESGFRRTPHRKDFAIPAPRDNLLDRAGQAGRAVFSLGKIGDIFDHRNTGQEIKGESNEALMKALFRIWPDVPDGSLVFVNLVDFDTDFGHRRDAPGYAACLEAFDRDLGLLMPHMRIDDLLAITADHGNDPTWKGSEHTRENAPVLCWGPDSQPLCVGRRTTFADIGASLARWLSLEPPRSGTSFF